MASPRSDTQDFNQDSPPSEDRSSLGQDNAVNGLPNDGPNVAQVDSVTDEYFKWQRAQQEAEELQRELEQQEEHESDEDFELDNEDRDHQDGVQGFATANSTTRPPSIHGFQGRVREADGVVEYDFPSAASEGSSSSEDEHEAALLRALMEDAEEEEEAPAQAADSCGGTGSASLVINAEPSYAFAPILAETVPTQVFGEGSQRDRQDSPINDVEEPNQPLQVTRKRKAVEKADKGGPRSKKQRGSPEDNEQPCQISPNGDVEQPQPQKATRKRKADKGGSPSKKPRGRAKANQSDSRTSPNANVEQPQQPRKVTRKRKAVEPIEIIDLDGPPGKRTRRRPVPISESRWVNGHRIVEVNSVEDFRHYASGYDIIGMGDFSGQYNDRTPLSRPLWAPEDKVEPNTLYVKYEKFEEGEPLFGKFHSHLVFESDAPPEGQGYQPVTNADAFEYEPALKRKRELVLVANRNNPEYKLGAMSGYVHMTESSVPSVRTTALQKYLTWRKSMPRPDQLLPRMVVLIEHEPLLSIGEATRWEAIYKGGEAKMVLKGGTPGSEFTVQVDVNRTDLNKNGGAVPFYKAVESLRNAFPHKVTLSLGTYDLLNVDPLMEFAAMPKPELKQLKKEEIDGAYTETSLPKAKMDDEQLAEEKRLREKAQDHIHQQRETQFVANYEYYKEFIQTVLDPRKIPTIDKAACLTTGKQIGTARNPINLETPSSRAGSSQSNPTTLDFKCR